MAKTVTKQIRERLDIFVQNKQYQPQYGEEQYQEELYLDTQNVIENKKTIRKKDGLIERMDNKIIIAEDNRQLLRD